jgi:hypothetical protein
MRLKRDGSDSWIDSNSCGESSVRAANPQRPRCKRDIAINALSHDDGDVARSERAIRALADASGALPEHVRDLFTVEFSRLERFAKIRTYLHVLVTARVRSMLSRVAPEL